MRFLTSDIERAGRDAGPHHVWWRRASVPAIFTRTKSHCSEIRGEPRSARKE